MRFLLDPRIHLILVAALLLALAISFRAERARQRFLESPSPTLEGRTDYRP
jgi:hypothetical protein